MKVFVHVLIAIEDGIMHDPEVFTDIVEADKKFCDMARESNRMIGITRLDDKRICLNTSDSSKMAYRNYVMNHELYLYTKEIEVEELEDYYYENY